MREGGENCLKYLKRGRNRTEGRGHKDFLGEKWGGGEVESRGGCYKKAGWNPPTNYDLGDLSAFETELQSTNRA